MRTMSAPEDLAAVRQRIRDRSPLLPERTEQILKGRFGAIPNRLRFGLSHWPLATARVLDVGCAYGNTLAFFGPGSLGLDNGLEQVEFCRAIGLDARQVDIEHDLDDVPDGTFDFVWVCDVLEHLDAPRLTLRDLAPKLAQGGRLLVYVTSLPRNRLVREVLRRRGPSAFDSRTHYYQFTRETAQFLIERAGYRVESVNVPALDGRWSQLQPVAVLHAPTLIFEAVPDGSARELLRGAENKNAHVT
jgi:SAM-dependent methyltransferase